MRRTTTKESRSGTFSLVSGREVQGELTIVGSRTSLLIHDRSRFSLQDLPLGCLNGVLRDSAKVSLLQCIPREHSSIYGPDGYDGYDKAVLFPHFVIEGDDHLSPDAHVVKGIEFLIDDAGRIFCDHEAFGMISKPREALEQVIESGIADRQITLGESPRLFYFSGKVEIWSVDTSLGMISARHSPTICLSQCDSSSIRDRVVISIAFHDPLLFQQAVASAAKVISYMGMIVGRPQNLVNMTVQVGSHESSSGPLTVHWSLGPKRKREVFGISTARKPDPGDKLLDPIASPTEFGSVLREWLKRDAEWRHARHRFFLAFQQQKVYDINRLIGSANMFDILPDSAVAPAIQLTEDLKRAQASCRNLFRGLPKSPERDSMLSAIGRMGTSTLKQKVGRRARSVIEACNEWFPKLDVVLDEAVNCRNFFVHGGLPKCDYQAHEAVITFFIDTLEFVFAASDLIEAGWNVKAWILRGTTRTHPYGEYRVNYPDNLNAFKTALKLS